MKLEYRVRDGVQVPMLELNEQMPVGKYGLMRLQYLKENDPALYDLMLITGELNRHLVEIDRQAGELMAVTMEGLMKQNPPPDKAADPMAWTRHMNNLRSQAEELVIPGLMTGG